MKFDDRRIYGRLYRA